MMSFPWWDAPNAYTQLANLRTDWEEYNFVIKRSITQAAIKTLYPDLFSYGKYTFCKTETDLFYLKLLDTKANTFDMRLR